MLLREARMKRKTKASISCNYDQDLLEDTKENKKETMISECDRKKDMNKHSMQSHMYGFNHSSKKEENLKKNDKETTENFINVNKTVESVDKFQNDNVPVTKEVQIVLSKLSENFEFCDTLKKGNKISKPWKCSISNKGAKTAGKKKSSEEPCNILSEELHLTKEVRIVLKRHVGTEKDIENLCNPSDISLVDDGNAKKIPNETGRSSKRKRGKHSEEDSKPTRSTKKSKESDTKSKSSSNTNKIPDATVIDFSNDSKSADGSSWNFKISSWNISGIRAWLKKNGLSYLHREQPDIMCVQETKCSDDRLPEEVKEIEGYHVYWLSGDKEGYSGVGLLSKEKPIKVEYGIGIPEHDDEGRVITAEYDKFYLVSSYVPNAGRGLVRLQYRMKWDKDFRAYVKKLDAEKPVVLCGDLNVSHQEIDLANPKANKRNAGFTKEEREGFSSLLEEGFVDTFRHFYPDVKGAYTFWTYMANARAKNVGWRLDYFVISERLSENVCDSVIRKDVFGSDHCPITLFLSV